MKVNLRIVSAVSGFVFLAVTLIPLLPDGGNFGFVVQHLTDDGKDSSFSGLHRTRLLLLKD